MCTLTIDFSATFNSVTVLNYGTVDRRWSGSRIFLLSLSYQTGCRAAMYHQGAVTGIVWKETYIACSWHYCLLHHWSVSEPGSVLNRHVALQWYCNCNITNVETLEEHLWCCYMRLQPFSAGYRLLVLPLNLHFPFNNGKNTSSVHMRLTAGCTVTGQTHKSILFCS